MARDDEYVEIVLDDDEDDDLLPGEEAAILRFSADPLSVEGFPDLFVEHLDMIRADAAKVCQTSGGILLEGTDAAKASAIARGMRRLGEDCRVVAMRQLIVLPRPLPVHSAALSATDMGPTDAAGRRDLAPWADALVMVMALIPHEETRTHSRWRLSSRVAPVRRRMVVGSTVKTTTKRASTRILLQIVFDDPVRCYEIASREFAYSILGDQIQQSSEVNIQTLARWFLHACPHVRTNFDREQLMQTARAELQVSTPKKLSRTARWLVNLERLAG